jgi:hypothetical protein
VSHTPNVEFPQARLCVAAAVSGIGVGPGGSGKPRLVELRSLGIAHVAFLRSRLLFCSLTYKPLPSGPIDKPIRPEARRAIHWTMVLIDTFASVGSTIALLEKTNGVMV